MAVDRNLVLEQSLLKLFKTKLALSVAKFLDRQKKFANRVILKYLLSFKVFWYNFILKIFLWLGVLFVLQMTYVCNKVFPCGRPVGH